MGQEIEFFEVTGLLIENGSAIYSGNTDPSSAGIDLPPGSLFLQTNGKLWKKNQAGWQELDGGAYVLQPATSTDLGGVKVGNGVNISSDGTISINVQEIDIAALNVSYIRNTPLPQAVGGAPAGTVFTGTLADALDQILYPGNFPAFASFQVNIQDPVEVGYAIPAGNKTFTWITTNSSEIAFASIKIQDVDANQYIITGLENDGSETVSIGEIQKTFPSSKTWRIQAQTNSGATIHKDTSIHWMWRVYTGRSSLKSISGQQVTALSWSNLSENFVGNFLFPAESNSYIYLCYPVSMGLKTSFKDASTGFMIGMHDPYITSVTNNYGITTDYYVHRSSQKISGEITIQVS